jgi:hypothetical protein
MDRWMGTFWTDVCLFSYSFVLAGCLSLSFLWRKVYLNVILPLINLAPHGYETEEETHLAKQKADLFSNGATKILIYSETL